MIHVRQLLLVSIVSCSVNAFVLGQTTPPPASRPEGDSLAAGGNLVLNGDFESYAGGDCDDDLSNAAFTSLMFDATAFGPADEIDVYTNPPCHGWPYAISGVRQACLRRQDDGDSDVISLTLTSPIVGGNAYELTFLASSGDTSSRPLGRMQVGVSTGPTSFGALVHTGQIPNDHYWYLFATTFVAPFDAGYLTVSEDALGAWTHVDAFRLEPAGLGSKYCVATYNSSLYPAELSASGSASYAAGDLMLTSAVVPNQPGTFFHGANQTQIPFGEYGFLCTTTGLVRGAVVIGMGNVATYVYDNSDVQHTLAAFVGSTRNFQYWYRDPMGASTLTYWNLSTAISIGILP